MPNQVDTSTKNQSSNVPENRDKSYKRSSTPRRKRGNEKGKRQWSTRQHRRRRSLKLPVQSLRSQRREGTIKVLYLYLQGHGAPKRTRLLLPIRNRHRESTTTARFRASLAVSQSAVTAEVTAHKLRILPSHSNPPRPRLHRYGRMDISGRAQILVQSLPAYA